MRCIRALLTNCSSLVVLVTFNSLCHRVTWTHKPKLTLVQFDRLPKRNNREQPMRPRVDFSYTPISCRMKYNSKVKSFWSGWSTEHRNYFDIDLISQLVHIKLDVQLQLRALVTQPTHGTDILSTSSFVQFHVQTFFHWSCFRSAFIHLSFT